MKMIKELFVVEYSVQQGYFHVEIVGEMLESNQQSAFINKRQTHYIPVAIFDKRHLASEFIERYRESERRNRHDFT